MNSAFLVWSGIWRWPARTILIFAQITVAFVLFGLLNGMNGALKQAIDKQRADVLYVTPRVRGNALPISVVDKIRAIEGVQKVNPQNFIGAAYQERTQRVNIVATIPDVYFSINDYCKVLPETVKRLDTIKDGAIVGAQVAQKYGWKSGDRIPLLTLTPQKDGNRTWTFEIVGTYEYPEEPDMANLIIINNDYFEEARQTLRPNTAARIVVETDGAASAAAAVEQIDEMFANSTVETVTISENESAQTRLESLGDLNFVTRMVTAVAFIALLLSVGTMMMHSVRERTAEIGILKALGFSNERVGGLLLAEAIVISITGSGVGLAIATRVLPLAREYAGLVQMPTAVVLVGIGMAIVLAAAFAWLPARYALRLRVVQALGRG